LASAWAEEISSARLPPTQLTTGRTFVRAVRFFVGLGLTPTMAMVGIFAAVVEAFGVFAPSFLRQHGRVSGARVAALASILIGAAAVAALTWNPHGASVAAQALWTAARFLVATIFLHGVWNVAFSRPDPAQRAFLDALREIRATRTAEARQAEDELMKALPAIEDLHVRNGLDLRGAAIGEVRESLKTSGDRALLPALIAMGATTEKTVTYETAARDGRADALNREYRVLDRRLDAAGVSAAVDSAAKDLAAGVRREMVVAVGDALPKADFDRISGEAAKRGVTLARNDAALFDLESDPVKTASRVAVFLSPTANLDDAALAALQRLAAGRTPDWLTVYVLVEAVKAAVAIDLNQLSTLVETHRLIATQA